MLAFYNKYLGPNNVDHLQNQALMKLQKLTQAGERKNWNFERFDNLHKEQHTMSTMSWITELGSHA